MADKIMTHPLGLGSSLGQQLNVGSCLQTRSGGNNSCLKGSAPQHPMPSASSCRWSSSATWTMLIATGGRDATHKWKSFFQVTESAVQEKQIRVLVPVLEFVKVRLAFQCQPVPFCLQVEELGSPSVGRAWEKADPETHPMVHTRLLQPAGHASQMRPTPSVREWALNGAQGERCNELRIYEFTQTAHG